MTKRELIEIGMDFFLEHFPSAKKKNAQDFMNDFFSELKEQGVIELDEDSEETENEDAQW